MSLVVERHHLSRVLTYDLVLGHCFLRERHVLYLRGPHGWPGLAPVFSSPLIDLQAAPKGM